MSVCVCSRARSRDLYQLIGVCLCSRPHCFSSIARRRIIVSLGRPVAKHKRCHSRLILSLIDQSIGIPSSIIKALGHLSRGEIIRKAVKLSHKQESKQPNRA